MLSIIIATLNEEKYLPNLLKDLSNQTYKDFEIIVVDGKSDDNTQNIAKEYGCKVISSPHRKQTFQQNLGAKKANGDLLLFFDADTRIVDKKFLELSISEFKKRMLLVASFYNKLVESGYKQWISSFLFNFMTFWGQFIHPVAHGANGIMSTKETHLKHKGFSNEIYLGYDHEYAYRLSKFGKFGVIKSTKTVSSFRRFEKEGYFNVWYKWTIFAFHYLLKGPVKRGVVEYDMKGSNR